MPRHQTPTSASEVAAHIKEVRGVHLHRFKYRAGMYWRLAVNATRKCGTPECFEMRVKNVKETEPPQEAMGAGAREGDR